jgi:hypothetical protein
MRRQLRRERNSASLPATIRQAAVRERRRNFVSDVGERMNGWLARLAVVISVGLLLGRLGPFGTFAELESLERYAYWVGLTLLMWLQGVAIISFLAAPLGARRWPHWITVVVAALLASIPTAFEVAWAEMLLRVERDLGPIDLLAIAGDVSLLSVPLLLLTHGWTPQRANGLPSEQYPERADRLVALMDPGRRGELLAVSSEDHYVRLYSDRASQLVAMRFADALDNLVSADGLQVHRRWWVATDAVESIVKDGDGLRLGLRNGLSVPVSRSFAQQVRKAWAARIG